ncbi:alpha/beta hydrolase [Pseudonocardia sp. NPDC049154]|uniref:alpha/beta hydrolase n=1 Tax=Pseudonocardia sp. NPDC049154 TaxID=3155501 RepID=UPI0034093F53
MTTAQRRNHRTERTAAYQELLRYLRELPISPERSIEEARTAYETLCAHFADPPEATLVPVDANGVRAEWTTPPGGASVKAAILLLHGGGFTVGSAAGYRDLAARLMAATGAGVLTIDYRLAPEHRFPAALDDATTALRWLHSEAPGRPVAVVGDSAGGGLAISLAVAVRDAGLTAPVALSVFSPRTDLVQTGASVDTQADLDPLVTPASSYENGLRYVGSEAGLRNPSASPLLADLTGLPPVYLYVGTSEILLDDGLRLARALRRAGVAVDLDVWPEGIHILPFFASRVPEAAEALSTATAFLTAQLAVATAQ